MNELLAGTFVAGGDSVYDPDGVLGTPGRVGHPVSVRPCWEGCEKTYLGVFVGFVAPNISIREMEDGRLELAHSGHNPLILIPELGRVVFGYESWWEFIETPEQMREITDKDIQDVWYVKAIMGLSEDTGAEEK